MLDGLRWQLHKLFDKFIGRHPGYLQSGGSISLFGHSLGSVICYDLLHETACVEGLMSHTVPAPMPPSRGMGTSGAGVLETEQTGVTKHNTSLVASCDIAFPLRWCLPGGPR